MPSAWDDIWMAVANDVAERSLCSRGGCGAVIVDHRNRIVATGYTGPPAGFAHHGEMCRVWCPRGSKTDQQVQPDYQDCFSIHAEMNAIAFCDRRDREGGTLYVTSSVCWDCAKVIANSGVQRVIVPDDAAHREPARSISLMRKCGLIVNTYGR
jgi:dCMP deaminase